MKRIVWWSLPRQGLGRENGARSGESFLKNACTFSICIFSLYGDPSIRTSSHIPRPRSSHTHFARDYPDNQKLCTFSPHTGHWLMASGRYTNYTNGFGPTPPQDGGKNEKTQGNSALSFFFNSAKSVSEIVPMWRLRRFASTRRICDKIAVLVTFGRNEKE